MQTLKELGYYQRNERVCPGCKQIIYDYYDKKGIFAFTSMCDCRFEKHLQENSKHATDKILKQNIERFMELSNLSQKDIDSLKEQYVLTDYNKEAYEACKQYINSFSKDTEKGFLFMGDPGTGKSYLCKKVAYMILKRLNSVLFTTTTKLIENQNKRIHEKDIIDLKEYAIEVDLLVLDDLGVEDYSNKRNQNIVFDVINERLNMKKPILYTTNLTPNELKKYDGKGRIYDRILDSVIDAFDFSGQSFRESKFRKERGEIR